MRIFDLYQPNGMPLSC